MLHAWNRIWIYSLVSAITIVWTTPVDHLYGIGIQLLQHLTGLVRKDWGDGMPSACRLLRVSTLAARRSLVLRSVDR